MTDDELLKRLCSNSILGQMPHPSFDRKPFDVAMHITEEERQELIAQRSEAADLIRELKAELAFYKGFHDGVCKDGTHVVVPVEPTEKMIEAGFEVYRNLKDLWKAMIRAAQPDAKPKQGE